MIRPPGVHALRRLRELPIETVHAGHDDSFGKERLDALIDSYLAGGQRLGELSEWLATIS